MPGIVYSANISSRPSPSLGLHRRCLEDGACSEVTEEGLSADNVKPSQRSIESQKWNIAERATHVSRKSRLTQTCRPRLSDDDMNPRSGNEILGGYLPNSHNILPPPSRDGATVTIKYDFRHCRFPWREWWVCACVGRGG
jgi:hypothetical protein